MRILSPSGIKDLVNDAITVVAYITVKDDPDFLKWFKMIVVSIFVKFRPEPLRTDIFEILTIKLDETDQMPDELRIELSEKFYLSLNLIRWLNYD